jgi:hypothetical protein
MMPPARHQQRRRHRCKCCCTKPKPRLQVHYDAPNEQHEAVCALLIGSRLWPCNQLTIHVTVIYLSTFNSAI